MGSLNGLFDLSRSALAANQAALNATANNVANQNTAGYTDKVASFRAGDTVTLSGYGAQGQIQTSSGPQVSVASSRDLVLEQRVQQQMQQQSSTSAESDVLTQIQNVFSLSGSSASEGSTAIGTALDSFFGSLTALAQSPADGATQQGVLSAAQTLASTFNSAATQLQQASTSLNSTIAGSITQVNALTATIAGLNQQISVESPHGDAGTLEDQRQLAIEQLSQYVGLDQIRTENNGITLTTQGGTVLVAGSATSALTASTVNGSSVISDSDGSDVTAGVFGGSIGGQLQAQSVDLPAVTTALDQLAFRIATTVNAQNESGKTSTGANGGPIFAIPYTASSQMLRQTWR